MGGVYRSDHSMKYLGFVRKTLKAYKKIYFHLQNLCEVQAYLIYKKQNDKAMVHREICLALVKALTLSAQVEIRDLTQRPSRRSTDAMEITRLNGRHFPTPIPPAPNSKKTNQLEGTKSVTTMASEKKPGLCVRILQPNAAVCSPLLPGLSYTETLLSELQTFIF